MKTVSVIGYGEIGSAVVRGIETVEGWRLGAVLTRNPVPGLAARTGDAAAFLDHQADLIIEAAGPGALRDHGPAALARAPVWSVGAVAMATPGFRAKIDAASAASGHRLRLYACGMADMPLAATDLRVTMRGTEIDAAWSGPLAEAVARWPDRLNTAVAAALNGPGVAATTLRMEPGPRGAPNEIEIAGQVEGIAWHRIIRFDMTADAPHPVARMLLCDLARRPRAWQAV